MPGKSDSNAMRRLLIISIICCCCSAIFCRQISETGLLSKELKAAALDLAQLHGSDHLPGSYTSDSLITLGQRSRLAAEEQGALNEKAHANLLLSVGHIRENDYLRALDLIQEALDIFTNIEQAHGQGIALHFIAFIHEERNAYKQGAIFYQKALEKFHPDQHRTELAHTYNKLGDVHTKLEQYALALEYYQKSKETALVLNRPDLVQLAHHKLGKAHFHLGDQAKALHYLQNASRFNVPPVKRELIPDTWNQLGVLHLQGGAVDSAVFYLERAFRIADQEGHLESMNQTAGRLFNFYEDQQDHEKALFYHKVFKSTADTIAHKARLEQNRLLKNDHVYQKELLQYEHLLKREKTNQQLALSGLVAALLFILIIGRNYYKEKTDRRLIEEKHNEVVLTRNQLIVKEKLAFLGQMAAGIAHEIKNPLNFVNNFAEGSLELSEELVEVLEERHLLQQDNWSDHLREIIQELNQNAISINENGQRANRIVNSIMQHAAGQEGRRRQVDLHQLLDENIKLAYNGYRAGSPRFFTDIQKDYDAAIKWVSLVPQDIERVLLNLITNACQALNEKLEKQAGTFSPLLRITTRHLSDHLEISVFDNGPGIPEENRRKIFQAFYTTKSKNSTNIGLGLSISYDIIVNKHRGNLEVESMPDEFTCFTINLPIQPSR